MKRIKTSKEERDKLWSDIRSRHDEQRKLCPPPPPNRDYDIEVRDGKHILLYPSHFELPAGQAEIFFWEMYQSLFSNFLEERFTLFFDNLENDLKGIDLLREYARWSIEQARQSARLKTLEELENIEDVRHSTGYYEGE